MVLSSFMMSHLIFISHSLSHPLTQAASYHTSFLIIPAHLTLRIDPLKRSLVFLNSAADGNQYDCEWPRLVSVPPTHQVAFKACSSSTLSTC